MGTPYQAVLLSNAAVAFLGMMDGGLVVFMLF